MKRLLNAAILGLLFLSPMAALAQNALDSRAATGTQGGFGHSDWRGTETTYDYQQVPTFGYNGGHAALAPEGWADYTNTQGASSPNGPLLYGTPGFASGPWGQSGAATSAPFAGTHVAPGNIALRQMGRLTLPPTRLTSFVRDSGMRDDIYGDEGTDGKPPYEHFEDHNRIESGLKVSSPELTTGHKSDAPSAWGFPQ